MASKIMSVGRGVVAGAIGGLAGSLVMAQLSKIVQQTNSSTTGVTGDTHEDEAHDPKVKLAESFVGEPASERTARTSKVAVHYGFGAAMGAVYGAAAALTPQVTLAGGIPFGAIVWLAADELGLKAFGLARNGGQPLQAHGVSLGTHLAFGGVTELVRSKLS